MSKGIRSCLQTTIIKIDSRKSKDIDFLTQEKICRDSSDIWTMINEIISALEKMNDRLEKLENKK